jgi:hypothetical protein
MKDDEGRCLQADAAARRAQLRLKEAEEKVAELNARAGIAARRAPVPACPSFAGHAANAPRRCLCRSAVNECSWACKSWSAECDGMDKRRMREEEGDGVKECALLGQSGG